MIRGEYSQQDPVPGKELFAWDEEQCGVEQTGEGGETGDDFGKDPFAVGVGAGLVCVGQVNAVQTGDGDGEDDGGEGEAAQKKGKRGRRKRAGKAQDKNQEASADAEEQEEGEKEEGTPANGVLGEALVFVVDKIDSVDLGERGRHIIFSVIG